MSLSGLAASAPILEVAFRHAYWRLPLFRDLARNLASRRQTTRPPGSAATLNELIAQARRFGIGDGDLVMVHASTDRFTRSGISIGAVLAGLRDLVAETGTLVMPAIPILKEEPKPEQRFNDQAYEQSFTYRKGRERIWTGMLPLLMTRHPGAVLSSVPLNTLVALGAKAQDIITEASATIAWPCGPGSAWERCYKLNAKILVVDTNIGHSLTMIHLVEDLFHEEWPIEGWYRDRTFDIIEGGKVSHLAIKERHPKWGLYFCENRLNKDLIASGVFRAATTESGLTVAVAESTALVDFLRSKRPSPYPYLIPSLYRKRIS
jgi:aminoglycoside 3-N-acetyltransferase